MNEKMTYYLDDLRVGMTEISPRRTVTEADIVAFAGLSGDFNELHTDSEAAQSSTFGERIAHGLLGSSIASGLFTRTAMSQSLQGSLIAMLGADCSFEAEVRIGDTLQVEAKIVELKPTSDGLRGVVIIERHIVNQHGVRVQLITTPMLIRRKAVPKKEVPIS